MTQTRPPVALGVPAGDISPAGPTESRFTDGGGREHVREPDTPSPGPAPEQPALAVQPQHYDI